MKGRVRKQHVLKQKSPTKPERNNGIPTKRQGFREKTGKFLSYTWKEKTLFLRRSRICFSSKTFFFLKPYLVIFAKKKTDKQGRVRLRLCRVNIRTNIWQIQVSRGPRPAPPAPWSSLIDPCLFSRGVVLSPTPPPPIASLSDCIFVEAIIPGISINVLHYISFRGHQCLLNFSSRFLAFRPVKLCPFQSPSSLSRLFTPDNQSPLYSSGLIFPFALKQSRVSIAGS